jgi:hypothetical protein
MLIIVSLVLSAVFGGVVSSVTGLDFLFWIAAGVFFICLLPAALVISLIHGEVSYAQDRADYREEMAGIRAAELAAGEGPANIYNDNRQIHFHGPADRGTSAEGGNYIRGGAAKEN